MRRRLGILILLVLSVTGVRRSAGEDAPKSDPQALAFFESKIRPLLIERCSECHGVNKQKSGLRVDSRQALVKGGLLGPAIEPGKPDESLLIDAVRYGDLVQMPPKSKLAQAEVDLLAKWVAMGAPWPAGETAKPVAVGEEGIDLEARAQHWSFQPVQTPTPPDVKDRTWATSPIDRFVLAKLEEKGLKPAPEADRRTLIRRLTYDLTGLPPTPGEMDAFLNDSSPKAYEMLVDRLLASPRFGERWGRHWLDLVRFAETSGHEFDYDILDAWRYRDYVIRAFNDDVPYNQFVVEHVAGDLMPEPRRRPDNGANESILGTGFYFLGEGTHSPVDVRDDEALRIDNQLDVFGKTFLGLTIACARCHDHKFDPIRQKDYYALAGYLQSSRHQHAFVDHPDRIGQPLQDLQALRNNIDRDGGLNANTASLLDHISAASELAKGQGGADAAEGDILFADFEGSTYDGWTPSGSAFGDAPLRLPVPDYQGNVASRGQGLVGSHNGRFSGSVGDRDALTGTLTSPQFTINRDYVGFLIGGGAHAGKTCVNLEVDGKVVLSATGENANPMRWKNFDVRPFRGKHARLVVVDQERGGWGNISLDHVLFSDRPTPPWDPSRGAEALARSRGLDPALLQRWLGVLKDDPDHLPAPLAALLAESADEPADPEKTVIFERFDGPDYAPWTTTGQAFGTRPTQPGDWRPGEQGPIPVEPGLAHGGLVSNRLFGVLRSPTFTIEHPFVIFRARGREGRLNVVVDGFEKIRSPIYGGLTTSVNSDDWRWHVMDVRMWIGHRAYIEASDGATVDYTGGRTRYVPGNGYLAIDEVRFSDEARTPGSPPRMNLALAQKLSDSVNSTLIAWRAGQRDHTGRAEALGWMIEQGLLAVEPDSRMPQYREIEAKIPDPTLALAILDGTPEDEYVFLRGNYRTPGDRVPRRFLEVLGGEPLSESKPGSGRLDLAYRLVEPSNPLPARVMANRLWLHLFGAESFQPPMTSATWAPHPLIPSYSTGSRPSSSRTAGPSSD